jgi:methionyl-tRNA formyltransferase
VIQLNNGNLSLFAKAAAITLVAPKIGTQLLKNGLSGSFSKLAKICQKNAATLVSVDKINTATFRQLLRDHKIDVLINARTRAIFGKKLLSTPRLGCLNLHHGLLPLQRGTFCDFHALRQNQAAGFSIHRMTPELDDGEILAQKSMPYQSNYMDYIAASALEEGESLALLLESIAAQNKIPAAIMPNSGNAVYYKTPSWTQLLFLNRNGVKI